VQLFHLVRKDVTNKIGGEVVSRLFFLIFFFYVARKFQTADFGALNVAISSTYILGVVFLDPGLNLSTIQLLVERPGESASIASAIFSFKCLMFIPMLVALYGINRVFAGKLPSFSVLLLAALYTLFTALLEYLCSVTNAFHRMDLEAALKVANRLSIVLFGAVALLVGRTVSLLSAMCVATSLACIVALVLLRRQLISISLGWDRDVIVEALKAGLPIAGTVIVGTIYLKWDLLVLSYFNVGKQEIGWYAGAFKIVEAFSALPSILGAALFPLILQLRTTNPHALDRLLGTSTKAILLFSIPAAATISLFSRPIISAVYGKSYLPGAGVLSILIWCIVPIFLYFYLMFVNIASGHAKHNLLAGCVALVAGLFANAILVPRVGYLGAAWSALIANTSFALLSFWKVCRVFQNASLPLMLLRSTVAGAFMVVLFFFLPVRASVQLVSGLVAYLVVLVVLGSLRSSDISLAFRLFQPGTND
jgi:O-antigen/teichoic acid export membrane protein